jgi:hypothetical protein
MHVASVSCGCCKSRSGYCICCNGYTRMLQMSVPNGSAVFRRMLHMFYLGVAYISHFMLQVFHPDIAYASHIRCKCFISMLICFAMATHVFSSCFRRMMQVFQLFQTYVANVSFRCCKSRLGVAYVVVGPICGSWARLHAHGYGGATSGRHRKPCGRRLRRSCTEQCGTRSDARHGAGAGHRATRAPK